MEGEPRVLSERENALLEYDKMQEAISESFDRLIHADDADEVITLTATEPDEKKISEFLEQNRDRLTPEAQFYLSTTIHLRRVSEKLTASRKNK